MPNIAKVNSIEKNVGFNKTILFYFQSTHKRPRTMTTIVPGDQANNLGSEGQVAGRSMINRNRLKETETEAELGQ